MEERVQLEIEKVGVSLKIEKFEIRFFSVCPMWMGMGYLCSEAVVGEFHAEVFSGEEDPLKL